jgi:hypothetical protein
MTDTSPLERAVTCGRHFRGDPGADGCDLLHLPRLTPEQMLSDVLHRSDIGAELRLTNWQADRLAQVCIGYLAGTP